MYPGLTSWAKLRRPYGTEFLRSSDFLRPLVPLVRPGFLASALGLC
jgi:hypothetical protein